MKKIKSLAWICDVHRYEYIEQSYTLAIIAYADSFYSLCLLFSLSVTWYFIWTTKFPFVIIIFAISCIFTFVLPLIFFTGTVALNNRFWILASLFWIILNTKLSFSHFCQFFALIMCSSSIPYASRGIFWPWSVLFSWWSANYLFWFLERLLRLSLRSLLTLYDFSFIPI